MLSNTISIKIDKLFNLKNFSRFVKAFSINKKLVFGIYGNLEYHIDDYHDFDVESFILKVNQNHFKALKLDKEEILRLKNETCQKLDFSEDTFYIVDDVDDIEKFMKLDHFCFACLIIEDKKVTHSFYYMEDDDDMAVVVDYDIKSNFEQFLFDYSKKYEIPIVIEKIDKM
ncbi:hypothetical protein [Tepidibacter aestuarii]|uniref:hypothetical protein n=1 Tax=Tepidibacter aestuarii TaxID=2925782 RepID=UPI0020C0EF60|nr:hypothetical protein [Tepidibacter aestuarii]CAH2215079.1 conserved protein of unknown function [Tepidibacter aestuarii]